MEFPFNTKVQYFTANEKKHIDAFFANEPQPGTTYTNSKGEERRCFRVFYPRGVITPLTVYERRKPPLPDGSRNYHTPCAKLDESWKMARIIWVDVKTNKQFAGDSKEWLQWSKTVTDEKAEPPTPVSPLVEVAKNDPKALARLTGTANLKQEDMDEHSQGGQWQKPTK